MSTLSVKTAGPSEARLVVDVITLAFSADPMARWSLPGAAQYPKVMPDVVAAFGGGAFAAGSAHILDGCAGAAPWLPPGTEPDGERLVSLMETHGPASIQERHGFEAVGTIQAGTSPTVVPMYRKPR